MKLKLTLQRSGTASVDLVVTADAITTVGDLAGYLVRADPTTASLPPSGDGLTLGIVGADTRALDPRLTVAESGLHSGVTVAIAQGGGSTYRDPTVGADAVVTITNGPDIGKEFGLAAGTSVVGRERGCEVRLSDPLVSRQHARITVTDVVEIVDLGASNGVLVGDTLVGRTVLRPGEVVRIGDTELTVTVPSGRRRGTASEATNVSFIRSPRLDPRFQGTEFKSPAPPEPQRSQPFPLATVVVSVLLGAVLFAVTRSLFTITFVVLTPLLVIATSYEQRREAKVNFRAELKQFRDDLEDLVHDATDTARFEVLARNREHPTSAECCEAVRNGSPLLWTRRPGEPGFAEFKLGSGRQPSRSTIKLTEASKAPRYLQKEAAAVAARFVYVEGVPVFADPQQRGAIGIAGPRELLLAAARATIIQASALHSPAELVITGIASARTARDWDWMKWLPHTFSPHSPIPLRQLASTRNHATSLLSELEDLVASRVKALGAGTSDAERLKVAQPAVLLLIEHDAPVEHARLVELAEQGWHVGVHVLWLATDLATLSAACRTFVELVGESPVGAAGFVHSGEQVNPLQCELVDAATAAGIARQLAPLVDIGARVSDDSDLPRAVSLLTLTGPDLASSPEAVIERWTENRSILTGPCAPAAPIRHSGNLRAVIGQSATETHAVDLRLDGPHALVGGTTGSGKSEMLQSWILAMAAAHSPQRLTFLLVDYKGGSAFRDCVDLPHTVGLVTDLSKHLVRRALTSLSAELQYREHVLAQHAAKDLVTLEKQGVTDAPPSLIIVVDEFAALVQEVPDFVDGVVNVAQRGRSLGLHLILATQRPAGVIKDNLRANTNLRIALRMADEDDSTDVLGSPEAAFFDQAIPGRAVSKTGPGRLVPFQTGYAGGRTTGDAPPAELLVEELAFGIGRVWEPREGPVQVVDDSGPTDIKRLVASMRDASGLAEIPPPRKPWLPELKHVYDLADQSALPSKRTDTELMFGVSDDPDNQTQPPVSFNPDREGNLAVYGTGGSGKSTALRTFAVAAGFTVNSGPCHVYGLDFGSRGLTMLEQLPHVGSIIPGGDHERLTRLIGWLRGLIDERAVRYAAVNAGTITDYRRRADAPDEARILLLVDGIAAFNQAYETGDRVRWFDRFVSLATDGRPVGVHVIIASEQRSGIPAALGSSIQRRIVLRMATADDYSMLDAAGDVIDIDSPPGRAISGDTETQIAVLGGSPDVQVQAEAVAKFARSMRRSGIQDAPEIRSLPEKISLDELPPTVDGEPVIGVSGADLEPLTMRQTGSFLIGGPSGSGRTTALMTVVCSLARARPGRPMFYFGQRRSPVAALPVWTRRAAGVNDVNELAAELAGELAVPGREGVGAVVVVENISEFVDGLADMALTDLAKACLAEDHLYVVEGETSSMASSYGLLGLGKTSRSGLALQADDSDGPLLFRTDFPRSKRGDFPPGRAIAVRVGKPGLAQIALPPRQILDRMSES